MVFKLTSRRKSAAGFTLVEFVVGAALGMLLLAAVGAFYLFSLTSFASVANYSELNRKNRYACDIISRDIRSAYSVASATPNELVLHSAKTHKRREARCWPSCCWEQSSCWLWEATLPWF